MGFLFLIIYILLVFWRPQEWLVPELATYHLLDVVVILAAACTMLEVQAGKIKVPWKLPHLWLISGLFLAVLMSHAVHTYMQGVTDSFEQFGKIVLAYLLIVINLTNERRLRIMIILIVAIAVFIAIHCYLQVVQGYGFGGQVPTITWPGTDLEVIRPRYFGIFHDANDTALFLVAVIPLCMYLVSLTGFLGRLLIVCAVVALIVGVCVTQSRGGYVAMAIMLFVFVRRLFSLRYFILASIVLFLLLTTIVPQRLTSMGWVERSSIDRVMIWGNANEAFKEQPLFGVGHRMITDYTEGDRSTHNSYVQAYSELGVFGYTFWFALLLISLVGCWRVAGLEADTNEESRLINLADFLIPSLTGLYVGCFFLSRTYNISLYVILALAAAVYRIAAAEVGMEKLNFQCAIRRRAIWLYPVSAVGSIIYVYLFIITFNRLNA